MFIRRILAVGCNYAAHAKELGNAVPKEPVWFHKPTSSYWKYGRTIEIPEGLESLDHKVELAVVISQKARDVPEATAMDYVGEYALSLGTTAREIVASPKSAGLPWTKAKEYDIFTQISSVIPKSAVLDPHNLEFWLKMERFARKAKQQI